MPKRKEDSVKKPNKGKRAKVEEDAHPAKEEEIELEEDVEVPASICAAVVEFCLKASASMSPVSQTI